MISLFTLLFENTLLTPEALTAASGKYIGIQVTSGTDKLFVLPEVEELISKQNWTPYGHHISIVPPPSVGGLNQLVNGQPLRPKDLKTPWANFSEAQQQEFVNKLKETFGKTLTAQATEIGFSNDAVAAKVSIPELDSLPPLNAFRHITIAVPQGGKPMNSNLITNWKPLESPVTLTELLTFI